MMNFGYVIIYVLDVSETVHFYERAFGLGHKLLHESGHYAEMDTGATRLAFASSEMAAGNALNIRLQQPREPAFGTEIVFATTDVQQAFDRAVAAGAAPLTPPDLKPWGQTVAYVRDLNGVLIELCTPILEEPIQG